MYNTRLKTAGNIIEHNGVLWFVSYNQNVLVGYDYKKREVTDCVFLDQSRKIMSAFNYIKAYGNFLILLPAFENKIAIVDLLTKSVKWIAIRDKSGEKEKFEYGIIWDDRILFFPFGYDSIISMDVNMSSIEHININELIEKNTEDDNMYVKTLAQQGKMVFFATEGSSVLMKIIRKSIKRRRNGKSNKRNGNFGYSSGTS